MVSISVIKRNIIANYIGQFFVASVGIFTLPLFLNIFGRDSYGLIGVYSMLQAWIQLFDSGLSATISRESSRFKNGLIPTSIFKKVVGLVVVVFFIMAILFFVLTSFFSGSMISQWSVDTQFEHEYIKEIFLFIILSVSVRWLMNPFKSVLIGIEKQITVNCISVFFTANRFIFVILYCYFYGFTIYNFFVYQLLSSVFEVFSYIFFSIKSVFYIAQKNESLKEDYNIKQPFVFAMSAGFAYAVWIFISQFDKLVLTKTLPLSDYASFSIAITLAAGITMLMPPMAQAILPAMTKYNSNGSKDIAEKLYFNAARYMGCITIPITVILLFFSKEILYLWTHNHDVATDARYIMMLYSIGNCLLAISTFQYYLQYSFGDLTLHYKGNLTLLVFFLPCTLFFGIKYGGIGTGVVWVLQNLFYLIVWGGLVHKKFKYNHLHWIVNAIIPSCLLSMAVGVIAKILHVFFNFNNLVVMFLIGVSMIIMVGVCMYFHPHSNIILSNIKKNGQ